MFIKCLCNPNARFTPLCVVLQVLKGKKAKKRAKRVRKKKPALEALLRQGEGTTSLRRSSSPRQRESFAEAKLKTEEINNLEFVIKKLFVIYFGCHLVTLFDNESSLHQIQLMKTLCQILNKIQKETCHFV